MNAAFPLFDFITGWTALLSLFTFVFCLATLRSHVDESAVRKEDSVAALFRSPIPPEHVLTAVGRRRVKIAKIAIIVFALTMALILTRNLMAGR